MLLIGGWANDAATFFSFKVISIPEPDGWSVVVSAVQQSIDLNIYVLVQAGSDRDIEAEFRFRK